MDEPSRDQEMYMYCPDEKMNPSGVELLDSLVLGILRDNKGVPMTLPRICKLADQSAVKVENALARLSLTIPHNVHQLSSRVWAFEPSPQTVRDWDEATGTAVSAVGAVFEHVGSTRAGEAIIRDERGVLYIAKEIDL